MSENKLLPCPFCQAKLKRWDYMPNVFFEHPYNGCILSGKKVVENEHDIKAWNTRKPMERIIERLEDKKWGTSEWRDKWRDEIIGECIEVVKEEGGIDVLQSKEC